MNTTSPQMAMAMIALTNYPRSLESGGLFLILYMGHGWVYFDNAGTQTASKSNV